MTDLATPSASRPAAGKATGSGSAVTDVVGTNAMLDVAGGASVQVNVQAAGATDDRVVEELYLGVLCRLPRPAEKELMRRHFAATPRRLDAAQDALWALLNSKEFLFNH